MFRIIPPADFVTTPWKNGGGITHEIAQGGGPPWHWRLSIAEVATDGPFSRFEGLSRVLTVIEGNGLDLLAPTGTLRAAPLQPLAFSGDLPVDSRMVDGPIRDLNVIHDPRHVAADVTVIDGAATVEPEAEALIAFLCLAGEVTVAGRAIAQGACLLGHPGSFTVPAGARGILVTLQTVQTAASNPATA